MKSVIKLNTFVHMSKSNELLMDYITKILNNKCKLVKYADDFDCVSLDLLYTSLKIMNNKEKISSDDFKKIDKDELKYYIKRVKGMKFFTDQVSSLKNEEVLVSYIKNALTNGEYIVNGNNVIFYNGLNVEASWLVDFANFIVNSLNLNNYLSTNRKEYVFRNIDIPDNCKNVSSYIKDIKVYEYKVTKENKGTLSYRDLEYLNNVLFNIKKYDCNKLKSVNSLLAKEEYCLSVNKVSVVLDKNNKAKVDKLFKEEEYELLSELLKEIYKCSDSKVYENKNKLLELYDYLRSLAHAYSANYRLDDCRKLFDKNYNKDELLCAYAIANYYIYYIYDEKELDNNFSYDLLDLDRLKPSNIDYETVEYKNIINKLSTLNKKMITLNSKINKYLTNDITTKRELYDNSKELGNACRELEETVGNIKSYREKLNSEKLINLSLYNINKTKIKYIKDSIIDGMYYYDNNKKLLVFNSFNDKDYHQDFHLEIELNNFIDILLSDKNKNLRINYY